MLLYLAFVAVLFTLAVFFRVERGDGSLLGMGAGGRDSLVVGFTTWRPDNGAPRGHEAVSVWLLPSGWVDGPPSCCNGRLDGGISS